MGTFRKVSFVTLLLSGVTGGAMAQLPEPIAPDPGVESDWVTLGVVTFEQIEEEAIQVAPWRARNLDMIAIHPITAAIECTDMKVTMEGRPGAVEIPIEYEGELNEDWIYKISMRGEDNNVTGAELSCRSVTGSPAVVQLYGIPDGLGRVPEL